MNVLRNPKFATLAALGSLALSACSPGDIFQKSQDSGVLATKHYAKVNTNCTGLNFGTTLDAPSLRSLVHCLNGNGALQPLDDLLNKMSPKEVGSITDFANDYLLNNNKRMYQVQWTYGDLSQKGKLPVLMQQFSKILANDDFVVSALQVLGEGYRSDPQRRLLKVLANMSSKVQPAQVTDAVELGMMYSRAKAFSSLESHFTSQATSYHDTLGLMQDVLNYISIDTQDKEHFSLGHDFLPTLASGDLFAAFDGLLGATPADMKIKVPRFNGLITIANDNREQISNGTTSLYHFSRNPVPCFDSTQSISSAAMLLMRETTERDPSTISDFIKRELLMDIVVGNSFCQFPEGFKTYYPSLIDLANTTVTPVAADWVQAFYSVEQRNIKTGENDHPMTEKMIKFLSDTGGPAENYPPGSVAIPAEDTAGTKRLIPVFSEFTNRNAFDDALLLVTLANQVERDKLEETTTFFQQPVPGLNGATSVDVLADSLAQVSLGTWYNLLLSLQKFNDQPAPAFDPAFTALRSITYENDSHPLIDLLREVFKKDDVKTLAFYETIFNVPTYAEFRPSVKLLAEMAEDGRLKDVIDTTLMIFSKNSAKGAMPIHAIAEPAFIAPVNHDLAAADLNPFDASFLNTSNDPYAACSKLDIDLQLADFTNPKFDAQVTNMAACVNEDQTHQDVVTAVSILRENHTPDGREVFQSIIAMIKDMDLNQDQFRYLSTVLLDALQPAKQQVFRVLNGLQYLITGQAPGASPAGEVIRPLLDLARPLEKSPADLRTLMNFGGTVLKNPGLQSLLGYSKILWNEHPEPALNPLEDSLNIELIKQQVKIVECPNCSDSQLMQRALEIIADFNDSRDNWEADPKTNRPYRSFTDAEFKTAVDPVLERLGNPAEAVPGFTAMQSLLSFLKVRTAKDVVSWLNFRSQDYRLIAYRYPGHDDPVVKAVNTLDRFELVLLDADFAPLGHNFALKFMAAIGEAWGDEPRANWPAEVQQWYPEGSGKLPPKLKDATDSMADELNKFALTQLAPDLNLFGFNLQDIKRRMNNLGQVLPSLRYSVPGAPIEPGFGPIPDEGLKLLRDLFWQIEMSTPPASRNDQAGDKNNLSLVLGLARVGILHHLGHELRSFKATSADQAELAQLADAFVQGSASVHAAPVFADLLSPLSQRKLLWNMLDQAFVVMNAPSADASDLDSAHQAEIAGKTSEEIAVIRKGWSEETARMRQMGAYLLADTEDLKLVGAVLEGLKPILDQQSNQDLLNSHANWVEDLLRSARVSYFARAFGDDAFPAHSPHHAEQEVAQQILNQALTDPSLGVDLFAVFKNIEADTQAMSSWDLFTSRLSAVTGTAAFQALDLQDILASVYDFFSGQAPDPSLTGERLLNYLAEEMTSKNGLNQPSDLEDYLILARDKPDDFNRVLVTVGHYNDNGDIGNFLKLVRRSLSDSDN